MIPREDRRDAVLILIGHYLPLVDNVRDVKIHIDNHLTNSNLLPMTMEEFDEITEVVDVVWVILKQAGINRKQMRS